MRLICALCGDPVDEVEHTKIRVSTEYHDHDDVTDYVAHPSCASDLQDDWHTPY